MNDIAHTVGVAILEDLLDAEREARALTERSVKAYQKLLLEIAEAIAPDVIEAALQRNDDPGRWDPQQWQNAKTALLKNAMRHYGLMANDRVRQQQKKIRALERKLARLAREAHRLRKAHQTALQANARLQRDLAARQPQTADASSAPPPPPPSALTSQEDPAEPPSFSPAAADYPPQPYIPDQAPPGMKPQTYQRDLLLLYLLGKLVGHADRGCWKASRTTYPPLRTAAPVP